MLRECLALSWALFVALQVPPGDARDVAALRARLERSVKVDVDAVGLRKFASTVTEQHGVRVEISAADLRSLGLTDEIRLTLQAEQPLDHSIWQFLVMRSEELTCVLRAKGDAGVPSLVITTWKGARDRGETPETTARHAQAIAKLLEARVDDRYRYRAIVVLGRFGKNAAEAAPQLETFLRSPDQQLREAASATLEQIRGK